MVGKKDESTPNKFWGHFKHTYIEIDPPNGNRETWGVLGYPRPKGKDQEVLKNAIDTESFEATGTESFEDSGTCISFKY